MNHSILLAFAHPDDESFGCSGAVAKYSRQGVPVDIICATRGERGVRLGIPDDVSTGAVREAELREAARIMGIRNIYFLGFIDAELDKADTGDIASKIEQLLLEVRAEVLITFGPDGITGHADHIAMSKAATRAFESNTGRGGPRKLYYLTMPSNLVPVGEDWGMATRPIEEITTTISISGFFDVKVKAIAAHQSQQDSRDFIESLQQQDGGYSEWLKEFASKEFFYRAFPREGGKETDLFE